MDGGVAVQVVCLAVVGYCLLVVLMLCRAASSGDVAASAAHLSEKGVRKLDPSDAVDAAILEAISLDDQERALGLSVTPAPVRRISEDVRYGQRQALVSGVLVAHGTLACFGVQLERDAVN